MRAEMAPRAENEVLLARDRVSSSRRR
jgi:hypothetical protein